MDLTKIDKKDTFRFKCQMTGVCCYKMEIFLNPYDILQISKNLNISTTETINKYILFLENKNQGIQRPIFKQAREDYCAFNENKKCTIHPSRPLSCRLFPLTRKDGAYYNSNSDFCQGLEFDNEISIKDYLFQEDTDVYISEADLYHELIKEVQGKYDFSKVDTYLKNLFYLVLYDFDSVFEEYLDLNLSNSEKFRLSLKVAIYIAENYFSNNDYDQLTLLENIFVQGDNYIAENIKR